MKLLQPTRGENKNAIVSNVAEADAVAPDDGVQLILSKLFDEDAQRGPYTHAKLEVIRFVRGGETQHMMVLKRMSMYLRNYLVNKVPRGCEV